MGGEVLTLYHESLVVGNSHNRTHTASCYGWYGFVHCPILVKSADIPLLAAALMIVPQITSKNRALNMRYDEARVEYITLDM